MGFGDSAEQSFSWLETHAAGYKFFEIKLTRNYDESAFREDLKTLFHMLGTVLLDVCTYIQLSLV